MLCWLPEIICSINSTLYHLSQFASLPLRAFPDDLYEESALYPSVKETVLVGPLFLLSLP